jgi:hypothetical protein
MERWYTRLALCLLPLALVPPVFFSLAEGWISLGGGEKDIILVFPVALWALIYAMAFAVMWMRHSGTRRCVGFAMVIATLPLALGWVGLLIWSLIPRPG